MNQSLLWETVEKGEEWEQRWPSLTHTDFLQNHFQQTDEPQLSAISTAALEDISHHLLTGTTFLKCPILFRLISYSPALNCFNLSKKIIQMAQLLTDLIFHLVFKWIGLCRHACITKRGQLQLKHVRFQLWFFFYPYTETLPNTIPEDLHPPAVFYSTELGGFMCSPPSEVYLLQTTASCTLRRNYISKDLCAKYSLNSVPLGPILLQVVKHLFQETLSLSCPIHPLPNCFLLP